VTVCCYTTPLDATQTRQVKALIASPKPAAQARHRLQVAVQTPGEPSLELRYAARWLDPHLRA